MRKLHYVFCHIPLRKYYQCEKNKLQCLFLQLFRVFSMPMSRMHSPAVGMDDDSIAGHALSDFLLHLENYNPSIPDSVVAHYLNMSGFESQDPR